MNHKKLLDKKSFTVFLAAAFVLLGVLAYFISVNLNKKSQTDFLFEMNNAGSGIKYIPSLVQCFPTSAKNIDVRWTKSYIIKSFSTLSADQITNINNNYKGANGLLVLESQLKTTAKTGSSLINISDLFRVNKNGLYSDALDTGTVKVNAGETINAFTYIPVNTEISNFDVEFCNFKTGAAMMKLDFNSDAVKFDKDGSGIEQAIKTSK